MSDATEFPLTGGCTCRAVRFRIAREPLFVHCCHCRWCQRETGSAFVLNALVEAFCVEVTQGRPETIHTPSAGGKGQDVVRCPECRVALWSHYVAAGDKMAFVRVGTLDDPDRVPPDIHIFTSTKQRWVVLPQDTPAVPEYYRRSTYWPADSIARREALLALSGS